ncbi:extensin family protein [Algicella marina]|uniref:extensin-like domain-containing protein n=1 Tax=Algicella marina TaxID=2683284 RepID=UPI0024DFE08D|nr:extensin family protein [Algicella marina]
MARDLSRLASLAVVAALTVVGVAAMQDERWNPFAPLDPNAAPTLMTPMKLARTARSPQLCRAALESLEETEQVWLDDREDSAECHIRQRARLTRVADARTAPLETRCEMALRLGMWMRHSVQPSAREWLGSDVAEARHFGSFSCRRMRTSSGTSTRMSAHATASAIDVAGFRLDDGRALSMLQGWEASLAEQAFWRQIRDDACTYFRTVLSPDYNALHADHFHFAQGRWPACR